MKPFPKWVAVISIISTSVAALDAADVIALFGPKAAGAVAFIGVVLSALSHSLGGTGGKKVVEESIKEGK